MMMIRVKGLLHEVVSLQISEGFVNILYVEPKLGIRCAALSMTAFKAVLVWQ